MNIGSVVTLARDNLNKIIEIGDLPQDSDEKITEHHFMIYMGLLMSIGGVFWGSRRTQEGNHHDDQSEVEIERCQ